VSYSKNGQSYLYNECVRIARDMQHAADFKPWKLWHLAIQRPIITPLPTWQDVGRDCLLMV
jgi:hypothetical protein